MFSREHISWIVEDIFRTEIVKQRKDSLAFFDRFAIVRRLYTQSIRLFNYVRQYRQT